MTTQAADLHRQLMDKVTALRGSTDWLEAMTAAARLRNYSLGNWLLLWSQAEARGIQVTSPAGYRAWQQLGRQVRKGERGFRILAPIIRRLDGEHPDDAGERAVVGFRSVTVFDVSQTEGDSLPDVGPRLLDGTGDADLFEAAVTMIEDHGYRFRLGPLNGPNGQTSPRARDVVVEEALSDAQLTKTAIHELAHVLLHADPDHLSCRGTVEVEAESVAYVVCAAAGLDTSAYSVAYVAGWAESTPDPARALLATGERVVSGARRILDHLTEHQQTKAISQQLDIPPCVTTWNGDTVPTRSAICVVTDRKEGT